MEGNHKTNSKMSKKKKILIGIGIFLVLIVSIVFWGYMYVRNKIYTKSPNTEVSEVTYEEQPGITNILLIGTDARNLKELSRADAIIIATIDNNNKKLKLTSIMRDTLVEIPGYREQKINAALALGGPELLMKTIKNNFNLDLNKYVMVNFWGFEDIVDSVGGIDVDIKDYEIPELNKYIGEYHEDKSPKLTETGMQHLDGQQALAYARIRKVGNGDYERTLRQRKVIDLVTKKFEDLSILKYPSVMNSLLPHVQTNIEPMMILNYAYTVSKFPSLTFEQLRIPSSEKISKGGIYKDKGWVLLVDKEQCEKAMKDFIFEDKMPEESDYDESAWKEKLAVYEGSNKEHINKYGKPKDIEDDDKLPLPKPIKPEVTKPTGDKSDLNNTQEDNKDKGEKPEGGSGNTSENKPENNPVKPENTPGNESDSGKNEDVDSDNELKPENNPVKPENNEGAGEGIRNDLEGKEQDKGQLRLSRIKEKAQDMIKESVDKFKNAS